MKSITYLYFFIVVTLLPKPGPMQRTEGWRHLPKRSHVTMTTPIGTSDRAIPPQQEQNIFLLSRIVLAILT